MNDMTRPRLERGEVEALMTARHRDSFRVLGPHDGPDGRSIRTFLPGAKAVEVLRRTDRASLGRLAESEPGLFEGSVAEASPYLLRIDWPAAVQETEDSYAFGPLLGELDLHLFNEGRHFRLADALGANVVTVDGVTGVRFAVWAPNAERVAVIGDFNSWDARRHPMRLRYPSGVWELFVPRAGVGTRYKFDIMGPGGVRQADKADPVAQQAELAPGTASIVASPRPLRWTDQAWMAGRAERQTAQAPISIYEAHVGSWLHPTERDRCSIWDLAIDRLIPYVAELGFTHLELLPITEHPFGGSWGYQPLGLFAPSARFGPPESFARFVDALHAANIGLILDWVPAHFPTDPHGLYRFDGTPLYEHADPREGFHIDWNTFIYNFGRREVQGFLIASALHWLERYHVDGLRVDAVASMLYLDYSRPEGGWTPNVYGGRENLEAVQFLQEMNATVHKLAPGIVTIAEESTSWPGVTRPTNLGGLGFSMKWNMGWMNDTLEFIKRDPIHRSFHHGEITFSMLYAYSENYVLPISHDEVVHGKGTLWGRMPGGDHAKAAGLRNLIAYQWAHPGKQLLFMGQEFGQRAEWSEERGLDWYQLDENSFSNGIQTMMRDANALYRTRRALWSQDTRPEGYSWIDANDSANNVLSFLRFGDDGSILACVFNFSGSEHSRYRLGLPHAGTWREVLNTDADIYNGSGIGNMGAVEATDEPWHGRPASALMVLPPLAALWFEPA